MGTYNPISRQKTCTTVIVPGMYECPQCGKKLRGVISKTKLGSEGIQL